MSTKKAKYIAIAVLFPILTAIVWVIWVLLLPAFRDHFLNSISKKVERNLLKNAKRKTKGLRKATAKKFHKR